MIRLHYSNRLESLIAPLAEAIARQQRAQPLQRVTIVVPNRVIEHFLQHRVSEAIGVAANLEFPFLRRFLAQALNKVDPRVHILDIEELELVLFESIRAVLRRNSHDFQAPRRYVEMGPATEREKELRTYRLARQLARLFREYSTARRPMLQRWLRPDDLFAEPLGESERWQRHLWASIFASNGHLRSEWKDQSEYEWMLLPDAFEAASTAKLKAALPLVVHVFGLAYAGPAYVRMFAQIGKLTRLNVYALNPCREFWEDVQDLSRINRESWARRHSKVEDDLEKASDPFNLDGAGDTPALRLWARPGREYIRLLNELTDCDFDAHFTEQNSTEASVLGRLQQDILNRVPQSEPAEGGFLADDGSLRFLACPGIAREAEIVANEIWSILEHDAHPGTAMRFHQIGVLVPDAMYLDYLPHIESAFSRLHQLPMNIVNRGFGSESPVREAIALLLRLPLGRFSRDEMLHLLNHPVIRGENAELDTEQASRWCEELGIFFGADADDLAETYIPREAYNWDQGLRRLALGVFLGAEDGQEPQFYHAPESSEYLPYETAQDETGAVAGFIKTARRLLADAMDIRSRNMTLAQWSRLMSDLVLTHIQVGFDAPLDERIRERTIETIESLATLQLKSEPVSYQIAYEIVSARIADLESQLAQFTEHGIAVGPLSALRSIPFRTIFLLGMNEAQFPEREHRDPIDVRLPRRKAGDVTPTERDRYLFLEALLAARERIVLSFVARDAKTGDRLEPSSVVRELQFILRDYVDGQTLSDLTIEHPISRYDVEYFPDIESRDAIGPRKLTSFDPDARRGATMAALRKDLARHCGGFPLPGRDEPIYQQLQKSALEVMAPALRLAELPRSAGFQTAGSQEISLSISALRKFLECPLQGAAQYALGIFEDEPEDLEQSQEEPIAQSILARTKLLREVFWKARGNRERLAVEYAKAFRISQLSGEAPAGPFAQAAQQIDLRNMREWLDQVQKAGCENLPEWHEIRMGRADEFAPAEPMVAEISIPLRIEAVDGARERVVKLHGSLGFVSPAGDTSLRLVLRDEARAKDFLGPFLSAIVFAAAGEMAGRNFHAIVAGAGKKKPSSETRTLRCPTAEQARGYLSDLLSDLLLEKNHYFLPIEAVDKVAKEIGRAGGDELYDIVNDLRDNDFARCSSDYGPIRDARRFDPPNIEVLRHIMERRFGLIRSIFSKQKN